MVCPFRVAKDMWNEWTVSIGIRRRKIYSLIFCNIFLVIIKCCYGNMKRQTCIHTTCPSIMKLPLPLESFLENEMQKLGANQRLKSGIFCVLECGICTQVESGIQHLESGIHSVESRISYCPGVPYMGCNIIEIIMEIMEIMDHK